MGGVPRKKIVKSFTRTKPAKAEPPALPQSGPNPTTRALRLFAFFFLRAVRAVRGEKFPPSFPGFLLNSMVFTRGSGFFKATTGARPGCEPDGKATADGPDEEGHAQSHSPIVPFH
jgi:hypothetical protein